MRTLAFVAVRQVLLWFILSKRGLPGRGFTDCYTRWGGRVGDLCRQRGARLDRRAGCCHAPAGGGIDLLAETGPGLGRPLVDTIQGSAIPNLKELRPGTVRILFCFDPWRSAILLVAGDKAGRWADWYDEAVPLAEQRYESYLKERAEEQEERR